MIELARILPESAEIDGMDVSFQQCPPKDWMSKNITWIHHDAFAQPPQELEGKYDIIHIKLFITLIRDGNPRPVLQNMLKMLSAYPNSSQECSAQSVVL